MSKPYCGRYVQFYKSLLDDCFYNSKGFQVCGNPMFFWSQQEPDCSQQNNNDNNNQNYQQNTYQGYQVPSYQSPSYQGSGYQSPSYQGSSYQDPSYQGATYQGPSYQGSGYQGPSYQETFQAMIADTLRALCDIVQSTVQASKQEIATLSRMFLQKSSHSNCESDETPDDEYNVQPVEPTDSNPGEPQSLTTVGMAETSTWNSKADLLLQNNNESTSSTAGDAHNSTSLLPSSIISGFNATLTSPSTTKPANSTTHKMNSEISNGTLSVAEAQNTNKTVSEVTTLKS